MPSLRNVFVRPEARVVSADRRTAVVEVDGLLCHQV